MTREFEDSEGLRQLIESFGWTLYDITRFMNSRTKPELEDLGKRGPAQNYYFKGHYFFAPIFSEGISLRDAYYEKECTGPCLLIDDLNHERWISLEVTPKSNIVFFGGRPPDTGHFALFSRLSFDCIDEENCVIAWSANPLTTSDYVFMRADQTLDTFRRYFRIVQIQNYQEN
ncbi:hypothetical protein GF386_04415 [Candidatus Pacearchaeota archaeon]|nr:hypothetical protein [Candidatus Pacearchaeota archaeon]MBD3283368.1 hypothetical protein [Candidatus Pacearchaeota archaeon]